MRMQPASPTNLTQGNLTMAVQPNATKTQTAIMAAPGDAAETTTDDSICDTLAEALGASESAQEESLSNATAVVTGAGTYPYNNLFNPDNDPLANFDISFNPAAESELLADGGKWDAFDLTTNNTFDLTTNNAFDNTLDFGFDFGEFVEDGMH